MQLDVTLVWPQNYNFTNCRNCFLQGDKAGVLYRQLFYFRHQNAFERVSVVPNVRTLFVVPKNKTSLKSREVLRGDDSLFSMYMFAMVHCLVFFFVTSHYLLSFSLSSHSRLQSTNYFQNIKIPNQCILPRFCLAFAGLLSFFCYLPGEKGCLLKSLRKHRSTSTNVEKH